jgi:hypothetical protein
MRALVMERFMVILIRWFFRRVRVLGMAQEVLFEVFDVGTLFLEGGTLFLECSLRMSIVELIELMLALIVLMSYLFWWFSSIKALISWARVVVIWTNE